MKCPKCGSDGICNHCDACGYEWVYYIDKSKQRQEIDLLRAKLAIAERGLKDAEELLDRICQNAAMGAFAKDLIEAQRIFGNIGGSIQYYFDKKVKVE